MVRSTLTPRRCLVLAAAALSAPLGDAFLSRGMKEVGPISLAHLGSLVAAVHTPWVIGGIAMLLGFLASNLTALSWADLTFVLPATSMGNVFMVLLSRFWLHEHVSTSRWIGVLLITAGVGFVARGPSYTDHSSPAPGEAHPNAATEEVAL